MSFRCIYIKRLTGQHHESQDSKLHRVWKEVFDREACYNENAIKNKKEWRVKLHFKHNFFVQLSHILACFCLLKLPDSAITAPMTSLLSCWHADCLLQERDVFILQGINKGIVNHKGKWWSWKRLSAGSGCQFPSLDLECEKHCSTHLHTKNVALS